LSQAVNSKIDSPIYSHNCNWGKILNFSALALFALKDYWKVFNGLFGRSESEFENYAKGGLKETSNYTGAKGGPRSWVCAHLTLDHPHIETSGIFSVHISAKSPLKVSPNPSEVITKKDIRY
jgi:hypothetical protein